MTSSILTSKMFVEIFRDFEAAISIKLSKVTVLSNFIDFVESVILLFRPCFQRNCRKKFHVQLLLHSTRGKSSTEIGRKFMRSWGI